MILTKEPKKKKKETWKWTEVLKCVGVEKAISERNREGSANSKQPEYLSELRICDLVILRPRETAAWQRKDGAYWAEMVSFCTSYCARRTRPSWLGISKSLNLLFLEKQGPDLLGLLPDQRGSFVRNKITMNSTELCALPGSMRAAIPANFLPS